MGIWSFSRRTDQTVGVELVRLRGEIDLSNAQEVRERLSELGTNGHHLVLDLDGLTFIDVSGVRALELLSNSCQTAGVLLLVVCSSALIRRTLDVVHLHTAIPVVDDWDAASRHLRENGRAGDHH